MKIAASNKGKRVASGSNSSLEGKKRTGASFSRRAGKRLTPEPVRLRPGRRAAPETSFWNAAAKIVIGLLVVAIILLNVFSNVLPVVRYYGSGMEPALHDRQILFVLKTDQVSEGDIAVFYYNNKVLIRRVICEGGKQLAIDEEGTVFINGQELQEPYLNEKSIGQCNLTFPYSVPMGQYFVMGDARETAMDSRLAEIGTVSKERIIGKVLFVL